MTTLLQQAFSQATQLPPTEQDALAALLLEEMADDKRWEKSFVQSQNTLAKLAQEALAEFAAGKTQVVETANDFAHH